MNRLACTLATAALAAAGPVCRYTVRDIGFVDLTGPTYEIVVAGEDDPGEPLRAAARDGNVAVARAAGARRAGTLRRPGLEPLELGEAAPDAALRRALHSPLRDEIAAQSLATFAFLVVVEGTDTARDADMAAGLARATEGLAAIESQLPRPIRLPLVRLRVARDAREEERVLLWSLQLAAERPEPVVCVLYGRGKLAGDPLTLADVERGELLAQLALVGETCECDTTRDWMAEPTVPIAWGEEQRSRAWDALGFDPESPMVKAEVTRILARGQMDRRGERAPDSIEALIFGYRESGLAPSVPAPRAPGPPASADLAPLATTVYEAGEGDWDFEEAGSEVRAGAAGEGRGGGARSEPGDAASDAARDESRDAARDVPADELGGGWGSARSLFLVLGLFCAASVAVAAGIVLRRNGVQGRP